MLLMYGLFFGIIFLVNLFNGIPTPYRLFEAEI